MPFGGVNASGFGRFGKLGNEINCFSWDTYLLLIGGPEGLKSLCSIKAVSEDRFFKLIQTGIPGPLGTLVTIHFDKQALIAFDRAPDYPLPAQTKSWTFLNGLLNFAYGQGVRTRIAGLYDLATAAIRK